jgi:hypothetical protein
LKITLLTSVIVDTGMLFSYFERDFLAPCNVKPVVKPTGQHSLRYMNHYPACINLH